MRSRFVMLHARAPASLWPLIGTLLACAFLPGSAAARERLPGPVVAHVERVIDGDTFAVRARIWPDLEVQVSVRPRGVDAPELFRPKCAQERKHAKAARAFLDKLIGGKTVILSEIENDKFAGRIDAAVTLSDARDLSQVLLQSGLAQPYDGGTHPSFCPR
jgi:endonuclease YncB( thermonuclease family)